MTYVGESFRSFHEEVCVAPGQLFVLTTLLKNSSCEAVTVARFLGLFIHIISIEVVKVSVVFFSQFLCFIICLESL
jgi:hypothetical protein